MKSFGNLRPIIKEELELMLKWRNAPSIRENMYTRHEISLEEHLSWWEGVESRDDQQYFMYEYEGKPMGVVGFSKIDEVNRNGCWAFYSSPDAPRGTGSKMEYLALEYAFSILNLHKLYCEVLAFNMSVVNLHKKFGFKEEGIFREHHVVENEFVDIYSLAILDHQWSDQRDGMYKKISKYK